MRAPGKITPANSQHNFEPIFEKNLYHAWDRGTTAAAAVAYNS